MKIPLLLWAVGLVFDLPHREEPFPHVQLGFPCNLCLLPFEILYASPKESSSIFSIIPRGFSDAVELHLVSATAS